MGCAKITPKFHAIKNKFILEKKILIEVEIIGNLLILIEEIISLINNKF